MQNNGAIIRANQKKENDERILRRHLKMFEIFILSNYSPRQAQRLYSQIYVNEPVPSHTTFIE